MLDNVKKNYLKQSICISLSLLMLCSTPIVSAAGIAAVKQQHFHGNTSAKIIVFKKLVTFGPNVKIVGNDDQVTMTTPNCVEYATLLSSVPDNLLTDDSLVPLRVNHAEVKKFQGKYPQSKPVIASYLSTLENSITNFSRGYVRYKSSWHSRKDYNLLKEKEASNEKALAERLAQVKKERFKFELAQKKKGLVQYKGVWMTKEQLAATLKYTKISKHIKESSIKDATWRVFQIIEDGEMLVTTGGVISHIIDGGAYNAVSDQYYTMDLHYCGTYTYKNKLGDYRKARSYCLNYKTAYAIVKKKMYPSQSESVDQPSPNKKIVMPNNTDDILRGASSGSGFFVGGEGYFITNYHVIKGGAAIQIHHEGNLIDAKIITSSKIADLALLKVNKKVEGLSLSDVESNIGSDIYTIGFPHPGLQGLEPKVTKGIISSSRGLGQDDTIYQIDASIQPGNSGGPICDETGLVVGVVVAKLDEISIANKTGSLPQNVNYAIKSSEVMALLRSKKINLKRESNEKETKPVTIALKDAISAVGLVIVR
jgi:S1-C subfamily serine protease